MKGRRAQLAQDYPVSSCPGVSSCLPLAQISTMIVTGTRRLTRSSSRMSHSLVIVLVMNGEIKAESRDQIGDLGRTEVTWIEVAQRTQVAIEYATIANADRQ